MGLGETQKRPGRLGEEEKSPDPAGIRNSDRPTRKLVEG